MSSFRIGSLFNVPIYIHWSLSIPILLICGSVYFSVGLTQSVSTLFLLLPLAYLCMIGHEYSHVLVGKKFGYEVKDVTLLVIGLLANFKDTPTGGIKEFFISIAGPSFNIYVYFALVIILQTFGINFEEIILALENKQYELFFSIFNAHFWFLLAHWNLLIAVFNFIPAFPMDGGRILRSFLSFFVGSYKATVFSTYLASGLGMIMILYALYNIHIVLFIIGGFVIFASRKELNKVNKL